MGVCAALDPKKYFGTGVACDTVNLSIWCRAVSQSHFYVSFYTVVSGCVPAAKGDVTTGALRTVPKLREGQERFHRGIGEHPEVFSLAATVGAADSEGGDRFQASVFRYKKTGQIVTP